MNPAALKANLGLMRRGATILVNEDAFSVRAVQKAGYTVSPLDDGTLEGYTIKRIPMSSLTTRAVEAIDGATSPRRAEGQEPVRARRAELALRPADRGHREVDPRQVRRPGDGGQPGRVPGGLELRRDVGADRRAGQGRAQLRGRARHLPQHQRHRGDRAGPDRRERQVRAAAGLRRLPDHARLGPAALARAPAGPGRAHDAGRGRDRGRVVRARRRVRRLARRHVHERPGPRPEDRDDRPGGDPRAADGDHRRPARRPVDRHADQDRAVRPAAGALRPPRRVAAAGRSPRPRPASPSRRSTRRRGSRSPTARR